jgi:hypothetical protein
VDVTSWVALGGLIATLTGAGLGVAGFLRSGRAVAAEEKATASATIVSGFQALLTGLQKGLEDCQKREGVLRDEMSAMHGEIAHLRRRLNGNVE